MNLAGLSADVLGLLLSSASSSFLILRLWKCGNRALNSKLAAGVTHVHLDQVQALRSPYPRMLSELRQLRCLTLKALSSLMENLEDLVKELHKLPESLQELRIVPQVPPLSLELWQPLTLSIAAYNLCIRWN